MAIVDRPTTQPRRRPPGRPRRYEEDVEKALILEAATAVIADKGFSASTLQDILDKAGVSTRSFYRYFTAKDELLRALYRREVERLAARLRERTRRAVDPRSAVEAWVDEFVALAHRSPSPLLGTGIAGTGAPDEAELALAKQAIAAPLADALEAGLRQGSFPNAQPQRDAHAIKALAYEVMGWKANDPDRTREGDVAYVLTFCLAPLGWREQSVDPKEAKEPRHRK